MPNSLNGPNPDGTKIAVVESASRLRCGAVADGGTGWVGFEADYGSLLRPLHLHG